MSRMSRAELLAWMSGKTKTLGWNSIVSYDRSRVNKILGDEYVLKTGEGNIVDPMSGPAEVLGGVVEVSNLTLGNPLVSFYNSTLNDSKVNLQMPLMGGRFTTYEGADEEQYRVVQYNTIQPGDELFVDMVVSLSHTQGTVSEQGEVLLNLGSAVDWTVNYGDSEDVENALGSFIQNEYINAPEENKKYVFGMIDINGDDPLTPVSFAIRTQPEPDDNNGGGAVVMFIRTKANTGGTDGSLPTDTSDFMYLIPDDTDGDGNRRYSGSVIVESNTVFENILQNQYEAANGNTISFSVESIDSTENAARKLKGENGYVVGEGLYVQRTLPVGENLSWTYIASFKVGGNPVQMYPAEIPGKSVTISPVNNELRVEWAFDYLQPNTCGDKADNGSVEEYFIGNTGVRSNNTWYSSTPNVNQTNNIVTFGVVASNINIDGYGMEWMMENHPGDPAMSQELVSYWEECLHNILGEAVDKFSRTPLPGIDVFTLSNLLFPGQEVLQLKDAAIPGDLVCFGQINPALTSYRLDPLQQVVALNGSTTFVLKDGSGAEVSGATWSVEAVNGGAVGGISTTGDYIAPDNHNPGMTSTQNIVKAVCNGITSQSVVTVVSGMQVIPAFKKVTSYDIAIPEQEKVLLSATTLGNASDIRWEIEQVDGLPGLGSLETHADGPNKIWFIPPTEEAMGKLELTCTLVKAVDTATLQESRSSILTHASGDTLEVIVKNMKEDASFDVYFPLLSSGQSAPMGLFIDGEENEYPQNFTLKVESGGGTLETLPPVVGGDGQQFSRWAYRAPVDIVDSCAVITVSRNVDGMQFSGYAVIPQAG